MLRTYSILSTLINSKPRHNPTAITFTFTSFADLDSTWETTDRVNCPAVLMKGYSIRDDLLFLCIQPPHTVRCDMHLVQLLLKFVEKFTGHFEMNHRVTSEFVTRVKRSCLHNKQRNLSDATNGSDPNFCIIEM